MKPQNKTKRLTLLTMLLGMAMIVNMLEPSLPFAFPGIKLGLANVLGLFALYFLGVREMYIVNIMRVLLVSLVRGTFLGAGFWPAFIGSIVSCTMVVLFRKFTNMSEVGISAASATFHNVGQILVIVLYFNSPFMISYLPIMLLLGIPTGILTGYLVQAINKRFKIS